MPTRATPYHVDTPNGSTVAGVTLESGIGSMAQKITYWPSTEAEALDLAEMFKDAHNIALYVAAQLGTT